MKAIIYYRKSTDRDDKQANSLEHQLTNCKNTAKLNNFEIVKEIGESRSAKLEGTRPGFNEMLKMCKTGNIDYIVIDEPKRLSRNNLDSARIVDLFDKKLIKGIYSTGRIYMANQINDIFLLQLDLSLSKMDNSHRSKDTKDKMETCIRTQKRFLGKAPFGYKNITIKKGVKDIIIDKKEAKIIKEIFDLRLENKAFKTIGRIIFKKYGLKDFSFPNRIHRVITRKFYYGVFKWNGVEYIGSHKPIITKEIFNKANLVGKGVFERNKKEENLQEKQVNIYPLKGFVRDTKGFKLTAYMSKGKYAYYSNISRSSAKVSISQSELFYKIGEYIKSYEIKNKNLKELDKQIIFDLLKQNELSKGSESLEMEEQIKILKNKQEKLLDMKLENKISEELYFLKNNKIEEEVLDLNNRKKDFKNDDFEDKNQVLLELIGSFYQSYFRGDYELKAKIIKKLMLELFIDTKKELIITKSPLFESSIFLKSSMVSSTGIEPVSAP